MDAEDAFWKIIICSYDGGYRVVYGGGGGGGGGGGRNPTIGYCQGMNFIVKLALLFMDTEDAFWRVVYGGGGGSQSYHWLLSWYELHCRISISIHGCRRRLLVIIICSYDGGYRVVYGGVTILPLVTVRG